jgi:hypothetical protein
MLKANELRIGNYVHEKHYGLRRVIKVDGREGHDNVYIDAYGDVQGGFIRPIPLTEEWIIKFDNIVKKDHCYDIGKITIQMPLDGVYPKGRVYYNSWCIMNQIPEYVHEFQNLVFVLEKIELQLSSNAT